MQCSVGPSSPKVWSLSVSPKELQDTLGQVGRDVLAVVQDMACYMYTATVSTQAMQSGEWGAPWCAQLPAQRHSPEERVLAGWVKVTGVS